MQTKIILDSIYDNTRLTTFQLTYPRFIHGELMTHRVFSRNASSSRAVPVKRMIKDVWRNPAEPVEWGANNAGMQSKSLLSPFKAWLVRQLWLKSRYPVLACAWSMMKLNAHKQIINRLLEPYSFISVVLTATDFDNFFLLRCHEDADPTIRALALRMHDLYEANKPVERTEHLPYLRGNELYDPDRFKISAARCARVSYLKHDGTNPSREDDLKLYERLMGSEIKHASPAEHQAFIGDDYIHSNLKAPWIQFRKLVENKAPIT